jgi:uncharacterized protein YihD (DUF1040 family)
MRILYLLQENWHKTDILQILKILFNKIIICIKDKDRQIFTDNSIIYNNRINNFKIRISEMKIFNKNKSIKL